MTRVPSVSLDSVLQDMRALQRGMELTRGEFSAEGQNAVLSAFLSANAELLDRLSADGKTAQVAPEDRRTPLSEDPNA